MAVSKSYAAVMSEWKVVVAGCAKHSDDLAKLTNQYMKMIADGNKLSFTLIRYAKESCRSEEIFTTTARFLRSRRGAYISSAEPA